MVRCPRFLVMCLAGLGVGHGAMAEELPELTLAALPMAIRDGRIAGITARAVLFAPGSAALAPGSAAALRRLAVASATDCFLTAQAVGHASPGEDGDELAAQKLAQTRAEQVRKALAQAGLPASSVAVVTDYRFSLREPRVTLWLFALPPGADCAGSPRVTQAEVRPAKTKPAKTEAARPEPAAAPATPAPSTPPPMTSLEVLFASGSSFISREGEQALTGMLRALPKDGAYRVRLVAGLDDAPVRPGDPAESARVNRGLAEQRLKRVGEWIEQRAEIRDLALAGALEERTRAPSVRVEVLPTARKTR